MIKKFQSNAEAIAAADQNHYSNQAQNPKHKDKGDS